MRALLAVLLLLTLAFAGCASKEKGGNDDGSGTSSGSSSATGTGTSSASTSRTSTGPGSTSATGSGAPAANHPPTGALAVTVNGTQAAFNLTGSDADDDALDWTLSFGDGSTDQAGSMLPSNLTHTFAVGNFTARYNLTDGKATTTLYANVTITAPSPGGGTTQTVSGSYTTDNPRCYSTDAPYDAIPVNPGTPDPADTGFASDHLSYIDFAVDPGTLGRPFQASFASGAAQDYLEFYDAGGVLLLEVDSGLLSDAAWEVSGTVPANAATGVMYGCMNLAGEVADYTAG